jgi:RHS repeat-associated protein
MNILGVVQTFATPTANMPLRYPGQWVRPEGSPTALNRNGQRDYTPNLIRYLEPDPIGIDGGPNLYAYVDGDPANEVDPEGLQAMGFPAIPFPGDPSPAVPLPTLPNPGDFRWHGCYGGPNWNNCEHRRESDPIIPPGTPGYHSPQDSEDKCYQRHDICMHYCPEQPAHQNPCKLSCDNKCYTCLGNVPNQSFTSIGARSLFNPYVSPYIH